MNVRNKSTMFAEHDGDLEDLVGMNLEHRRSKPVCIDARALSCSLALRDYSCSSSE